MIRTLRRWCHEYLACHALICAEIIAREDGLQHPLVRHFAALHHRHVERARELARRAPAHA